MTRPLLSALALFSVVATASTAVLAQETCPNPKDALGVSRIVEIDTTAGPLFGDFTRYEKEPRFLGPKEVVLTFDDGPLPRYTKPILDALDKYCTKATFFYVGKMAMAYPDMVKEVIGRGHTVGTHTWSHPLNLRRLSLERAEDQIERGFAAVALAAGKPIAPFFRFPGLSDSPAMLNYMQERGVGAFTVDVVSNDSYISNSSRLAHRTIAQVEKQNGGIILFHDIKSSTARALPTILSELKKRGYKVVALRSKTTYEPKPELTAELEKKYPKLAPKPAEEKTAENETADDAAGEKVADTPKSKKPELKPFYEAIMPSTLAEEGETDPSVTELAPQARERINAPKAAPKEKSSTSDAKSDAQASATETTNPGATNKTPRKRRTAARKAKAKPDSSNQQIMSLSAAVTSKY